MLVALLLCAAAAAAPILDGLHIRETTLPNGLHVVVKEEPYWGLVAVGFCVKAAPLYEADDQHGLADLVRFMMFQASDKANPAIGEELADLGISFDTYTSQDATQIRAVMSTAALPEVFPRLVKAIFEPRFDEAVWAKRLPELRRRLMDAQNTATGRLWRSLWDVAFRVHPYKRPVTGTPDTMAGFDSEDLSDFHKALYVPNNMSLIVVGDVRAETVFDLAGEHTGGYPKRALELPAAPPEPELTDSRTRLEKASGRGTFMAYAWHAAGMDKKRDVCTLDLIYAMLGEGPTSRLGKALLDKDEVDAVPDVEFITKRDPGLFIIWCVAKRDAEFDTRETILAELEKLRAEKVSEAELASARELIYAGYAFDSRTYAGQVGSLAFYEAIDSYQFAADYISEVEKVTVDDIQRVAREYLGPSNYTLVIIRPKTGGGRVLEASLIP